MANKNIKEPQDANLAPVSNTGAQIPSEGQYVGIDWISVSIPCPVEERDLFVSYWVAELSELVGCVPDGEVRYGRGGIEYYSIESYATVKWATEVSVIPKGFVFLELKGAFFNAIGREKCHHILKRFKAFKGKSTRLDIKKDLIGSPVNVKTFQDALENGCYVGRAKQHTCTIGSAMNGQVQGHTVYIGSRQSEVFFRIYDKGLQQKTADFGFWTRIEGEFKGETADAFLSILSDCPLDRFEKQANDLLFSAIDFRDRSKINGHHIERAPRLGWFAEISANDSLKVIPKRRVSSIVKTMQFISDKMSGIIAAVYEALDYKDKDAWIEAILRTGQEKWTRKHLAMIQGHTLYG